MSTRYAITDLQWDRIKDWLPGRKETVGVTAKGNGCSWMPLSIVTEREYRGETCPENSVIGKMCIYGIPVGQKREFGKGYFANFLGMSTTNIRQ